MKALLALVLFALLAFVNAAVIPCNAPAVIYVNGSDDTYGCSTPINLGVSLRWTFNETTYRKLYLSNIRSYHGLDAFTLTYGAVRYEFDGNSFPRDVIIPPGVAHLQYRADNTYHSSGWSFRFEVVKQAITPVVSGQPLTVKKQQTGGFVQFAFNGSVQASRLNVEVNVYAYDGLRPPALFLSSLVLPTLEHYEFNASAVSSGSTWTASISVPHPINGTWFPGVFLYGSAAQLSIKFDWEYDLPFLSNGVIESRTGCYDWNYYQVIVPRGTPSLNFKVSRQEPGGYPQFYIGRGYFPASSLYDYLMDTKVESYQSLTINYPYSVSYTGPNPGLFVLGVDCGNGAGYILRADW